MLPRPLRLRRSADIRRVTTTGRRFVTPYFTAYCLKSSTLSPPQAAVVVGKRVHKSAVVRHRYQRWLRALLRHSLTALPPGVELVVVGRPDLVSLTSQQLLYPHWQDFITWINRP